MARDVKVGLFVLAGLFFAGLVIFLIGDERRLFETSVEFKTSFSDVQGLKAGAPIRMGGIDIGQVTSVGYGDKPSDTTVYVTLDIASVEAERIKTDSRAEIITKGLLGDKMIEITKGVEGEAVPVGGIIPGNEPEDTFGKVTGIAEEAEETIRSIRRVTDGLGDDGLNRDIRGSAGSLNIILEQVASGDGYAHRFLTDKAEADRISRTLDNLDRTANELSMTLAEVRQVVARVKQGPGFAHDLIYGDGPTPQIKQFGDAAGEAALALRGIRESESLMHDVLYGGDGSGAVALDNIGAMTGDMRAIMGDVRKGKGTIGALLVDPSIYEDLKMVLGNVNRNEVLRALVRYSIKQDEAKPSVTITDQP